MSDQGDAPETTETQEAPDWLAPIQERMDELRDQNLALQQYVGGLYQTDDDDEYEDDDEPYLAEEDMLDEEGQITPEAAQALIAGVVGEQLDSRLSERDAIDAIEVRNDAYEDLCEEYPDLSDPDIARPLVLGLAAELEQSGNGYVVDTPQFVDLIERTYKAMQYDERAAQEQPARRGVVLESGQGAALGDSSQDVDWGDRILKAAERLRPQI